MPEMAIDSILQATSNKIYIGYINESDIAQIPEHPHIQLLKIDALSESIGLNTGSAEYMDFTTPNFYQLVQLKWVLLKRVCELGFKTIIFSDFDMIWHKDPTLVIQQTFDEFPEVEIQIQTYTSNPSNEQLCMGFVALRNSQSVRKYLTQLQTIHADQLLTDPFTGDDNVISFLYKSDQAFRNSVRLLPQSTFPTGNLINVFSRRESFPGLSAFEPFIFHANFVVGTKKKILLMQTFQLLLKKPQFRFFSIKTSILRTTLLIRRFGVFLKRLIK